MSSGFSSRFPPTYFHMLENLGLDSETVKSACIKTFRKVTSWLLCLFTTEDDSGR